MATLNRNRHSVADLEEELYNIFTTHPDSRQIANDEPAIPASALVDVFRIFGEHHDGMQLLMDDEESKLNELVSANPGLEVTPNILLGFLSALAAHSSSASSGSSGSDPQVVEDRGRDDDSGDNSGSSSRSSSRGPPQPPRTPNSTRVVPDSPFDSGRRQRTAPLTNAAPSSWSSKRPLPSTRRRSDAGSYGRAMSDTESAPPSRPGSRQRSRAPSNPASPHGSHADLWGAPSPPMRPSSRAHSHGQYSMSISTNNMDGMSPNERMRFDYDQSDPFERSPRHPSDSDSEDGEDVEDSTLGGVLPRNASVSMALVSREREEVLERTNQELQRKIMEQDRILQNKIAEHEAQLEEMENLLDETKSELSSSMREEKELRAKETKYIHQISALESEIAERQRALETSKASYQSLQKQYQEQCAEAESLRNALRNRDQQYRDQAEKIALHGMEINKWLQQQEQMELHVQHLETQLAAAREAQAHLDDQKQENMLLKETIDRMRFDMDELRTKADGSLVTAGSSGRGSHQGSISKSLGAELMKMNGKWPGGEDTDEEDESTAVSDDGSGGGSTEGEDVVQTIITRRKKKVTSRATKKVETIEFEDVKHYSDAYTQHDTSEFTTSSTTQTDPKPKRVVVVFNSQTESTPIASSAAQTDPIPAPPPIVRVEMETQTDTPDPEPSGSTTPEEGMASSSSTLLPPTPKPATRDLPPSYAESSKNEEEQEQRDMRIAAETIRKWHKGLDMPLLPVRGGVSDDALEEWASLKGEMGFECLAIDKVLEMSLKTGQPRDRGEGSSTGGAAPRARRNRFYNIYNTFVYGQTDADRERDRDRSLATGLTQAAVVLGVCVLAAGVLSGPYMQQQYHVPGGPTYYDRAAWSEFNRLYPVGEGLMPDGAATVWDFVGRVGGEAARMARGWPT